MNRFNWIFYFIAFFFSWQGSAHHYKGLPHFSYFENYPQVPYLEFIKETPDYEIFVTVYNFQGLNLEQVESPDVVRFYLYIFDLDANKVYKKPASFSISSHDKIIHETGMLPAEQENIFVIQKEIKQQDDLILKANFKNSSGEMVEVKIPFQITKTFFQKYGLYLAIALFFLVVIVLKLVTTRLQKNGASEKQGGQLIAK